MIIEKQTFKSKSELQTALQKLKVNKSVFFPSVDKKGLQEIIISSQPSKRIAVIIIEL